MTAGRSECIGVHPQLRSLLRVCENILAEGIDNAMAFGYILDRVRTGSQKLHAKELP